jgi:hypothetical protein
MKSVPSPFKWSDALLLLIAVVMVALYVATANGGFPLDDSWIHQVYGRNLGQQGEWAFVRGVPSAASTSPLYTVLLAVGYKLNIAYPLWTHALGVIALWIAAMVGARMAERLLPQPRLSGLIVGLTLALAWHLIWAAASGMETMLFSMWMLVLIALAWRELDGHAPTTRSVSVRGALFGACAALATLTRPEGVVLAGLIGLLMLAARPQSSWQATLVWCIGAAIGFLIFVAPYLVYNLRLTGGLLPDTAAAKQAENAPLLAVSYPARIINMLFPLVAGGQVLLVPGIIYWVITLVKRLRHKRTELWYLLPLLWGVVLIALYAARLPAPYQHGRYVIPALPALILVGAAGTLQLVVSARQSLGGRVLSRALAASAGLSFLYFALIAGPVVYRQDVTIIDQEMVAAAHWIQANISPDQLLAVHDIGAVGYFAPRPILDLAGLVSPEIVPFILDEEPLWNWLQGRGARYLMAFPDQVPGKDINDPRLCPVFVTGGAASPAAGGTNMAVYALTWDGTCSQN